MFSLLPHCHASLRNNCTASVLHLYMYGMKQEYFRPPPSALKPQVGMLDLAKAKAAIALKVLLTPHQVGQINQRPECERGPGTMGDTRLESGVGWDHQVSQLLFCPNQ